MRLRNVTFDLLGVAILVLKGRYGGPGEQFINAYAGNVAVSFSMYFLVMLVMRQSARGRVGAALITLIAVTLFEITDGFGVMGNIYDPWDLTANGAGVCLAVVVDLLTVRFFDRPSQRDPPVA